MYSAMPVSAPVTMQTREARDEMCEVVTVAVAAEEEEGRFGRLGSPFLGRMGALPSLESC